MEVFIRLMMRAGKDTPAREHIITPSKIIDVEVMDDMVKVMLDFQDIYYIDLNNYSRLCRELKKISNEEEPYRKKRFPFVLVDLVDE